MKTHPHFFFPSLLAVILCSCASDHSPNSETILSATDRAVAASKRKLSDIKFTTDLTREKVAAIWGTPDGLRGSGVSYIEYTLKNGQEVLLDFLPEPPHRLNGAFLVGPREGQLKPLY